jgi:hypothetical protein
MQTIFIANNEKRSFVNVTKLFVTLAEQNAHFLLNKKKIIFVTFTFLHHYSIFRNKIYYKEYD